MEFHFLPDAGHDAGGDDGKGPSDDDREQLLEPEDTRTLFAVETATTGELSLAVRSATPVHDVDPSKPKRWRANMGGSSPHL